MSDTPTYEQCPICVDQAAEGTRLPLHTLKPPTRRFRVHDIGFLGRARHEQWRMQICPASGHTLDEAKIWAAKIRIGAVGAPVIRSKP